MGNRHLQRLYDDACDVGFMVKSDITGSLVTYYMSNVLKDAEQEVLGWEYRPTVESIHSVPECADTRAVVFND
jgi:hypothetical protein